jgi:hypothetical protein
LLASVVGVALVGFSATGVVGVQALANNNNPAAREIYFFMGDTISDL